MAERIPPQSIEAEQSVLGSMLIDNREIADVVEILSADDFYREAHRLIFEAILALFGENEAVDFVTVTDRLKKAGTLEKAGGIALVTSLCNLVPVATNAVYYAKIVREKSQLRGLIRAATEIAGRAYEDSEDVDNLMDEAEKQILDVTAMKKTQEFVPMQEILLDTFHRIEVRANAKGALTGLASGFTDLDNLTSGFQKSDLILVAARPSMGKTAFTLNIATYVAVHEKQPVAFFSLEMSKEQLVSRMLSSEGAIDSSRLRSADLDETDWARLIDAADRLNNAHHHHGVALEGAQDKGGAWALAHHHRLPAAHAGARHEERRQSPAGNI